MTIKQKIDQDLKAALLAGEKDRATTLRGIKSSILNQEIATGKRDSGLSDKDAIELLSKEAKKRQESADLYKQAGESVRQNKELEEKAIIKEYLPEELSEEAIKKLIDRAIDQFGEVTPQTTGKVIGFVRQHADGPIDGAKVAKLVQEKKQ